MHVPGLQEHSCLVVSGFSLSLTRRLATRKTPSRTRSISMGTWQRRPRGRRASTCTCGSHQLGCWGEERPRAPAAAARRGARGRPLEAVAWRAHEWRGGAALPGGSKQARHAGRPWLWGNGAAAAAAGERGRLERRRVSRSLPGRFVPWPPQGPFGFGHLYTARPAIKTEGGNAHSIFATSRHRFVAFPPPPSGYRCAGDGDAGSGRARVDGEPRPRP